MKVRGLGRAALGLAWLPACLAGAQAPTPVPAPEPAVAPLLGEALGSVAEIAPRGAAGAAGGAAQPGLFNRLARQVPAAKTAPRDPAAKTRITPVLGWAMEQLDPNSFAVLRPVPVAGSGARLRTGDVFVIQFSTNLPGQVRLESTDSAGRSADLGTYTVLVDQLNRLPRDKGIQLQGQPGVERLRFLFYPCLPPEAASRAWAGEFKGRLPDCGSAPALALAANSAPGTANGTTHGTVAPRALVNLAQPDATMAFAGASDYVAGEVTAMEAQIRHEARAVPAK